MPACLLCQNPTADAPLCATCRQDPFRAEDARKLAARRGDYSTLSKLYGEGIAYLPQGKVEALWTHILEDQPDDHFEWNTHRTRMAVSLVKKPPRDCLDIACGKGYALREIRRRFPATQLFGTDLDEKQIASLSASIGGRFAAAPVDAVPFGKKFELALLLEVLEHVEVPRSQAFLRAVHQLLEDDGKFVISVPAEDDLRKMTSPCPHCGVRFHSIGHVRSYSRELIRAELRLAGFEVEQEIDVAGGQYFGILRQRLMPWFPKRIRPMVYAFRCRKVAPLAV